ncbi:MAG: hypothetical protein RLZ35_821 [Pseudomonadota bacterium]|jgi:hypothetical protein
MRLHMATVYQTYALAFQILGAYTLKQGFLLYKVKLLKSQIQP